jgi:uroporphyrinogen-III synthase
MRLLVTRPEREAQRTAAMLSTRGHEVCIAPLLEIEAIPGADLGSSSWQAVLMTSANAARAIAGHPKLAELRSLPVLAVGRGTAEAARAAGFADVTSAQGSAGDLARLVAGRFASGARLLYLAGRDRARDLAADLGPYGAEVLTIEIYRAHAAQAFPAAIAAALQSGEIEGVLHFSRRSAEAFVECAERAGIAAAALRPFHFCISAHAAEPLARAGAAANRIRIAAKPVEDAVVALAAPG